MYNEKVGEFISVCAEGWSDYEATLACEHLGFNYGYAFNRLDLLDYRTIIQTIQVFTNMK